MIVVLIRGAYYLPGPILQCYIDFHLFNPCYHSNTQTACKYFSGEPRVCMLLRNMIQAHGVRVEGLGMIGANQAADRC